MRLTILLALFLVIGCSDLLDESRFKEHTSFVMSDRLMGTIVQSTDKSDIGKTLTFIGLNSDQPEVLFESGMSYPLKKIFENERTLSLALAPPSKSGGLDDFVIDKRKGKFSRISAGLIEIKGVYSVASLGVFK